MLLVDKKENNVGDISSIDLSNVLVVIPGYVDNNELAIIAIHENDVLVSYKQVLYTPDKFEGYRKSLEICDILNMQLNSNFYLTSYNLFRDTEYVGLRDYINNIDDYETAHITCCIYECLKNCMKFIDTETKSYPSEILYETYKISNLYKKDEEYLQKYIDYENSIRSGNVNSFIKDIIKDDLTKDEAEIILNEKIQLLNDVEKYGVLRYIMTTKTNNQLYIKEPYNLFTKQLYDSKLMRKIHRYLGK
jgi:hypothetical protein